jgi:hypothetical protein
MKFRLAGSVTIPPRPRSVGGLIGWARGVNRALQELRDRKIVGTNLPGKPSSNKIPFKLTARIESGTKYWKVSQERSSIIDGTNGDAIDLGPSGADWASGAIKFDTDTAITATKYIVLKGAVSSTLVITDWTLAAVDAADADEVGFDGDEQDEIRLLIGKVTIDTVPDPDTILASQAVFSPQRITHGLLNAAAVKVFDSAPIQIDNL